eukprot:NODE_4727_length_1855_cov_2.872106.p1 GENE.NODE_4727_length_1855_cov_2.872106~~NODE_4727_length_1855_cov_2.872106.p1  ORF type:complete len:587 (-),score=120.15 NODE_4727_length_1855_cov_2.872106:93-1853(-)
MDPMVNPGPKRREDGTARSRRSDVGAEAGDGDDEHGSVSGGSATERRRRPSQARSGSGGGKHRSRDCRRSPDGRRGGGDVVRGCDVVAIADRPRGGRPQQHVLNLSRRQLRDEDVLRAITREFPEQETYPCNRVDFSHNRLTSDGAEKVVGFCRRCPNLTVLKLFNNHIDDEGASGIGSIFQHCQTMEEVHLSHNRFTRRGIETIVAAAHKSFPSNAVRPLWLRLENNVVEGSEDIVHHLERSYSSVCGLGGGTPCTPHTCTRGRYVHLPFFVERTRHAMRRDERDRRWQSGADGRAAPRSVTRHGHTPSPQRRRTPSPRRRRSPRHGYSLRDAPVLRRGSSCNHRRDSGRDRYGDCNRDHGRRRDERSRTPPPQVYGGMGRRASDRRRHDISPSLAPPPHGRHSRSAGSREQSQRRPARRRRRHDATDESGDGPLCDEFGRRLRPRISGGGAAMHRGERRSGREERDGNRRRGSSRYCEDDGHNLGRYPEKAGSRHQGGGSRLEDAGGSRHDRGGGGSGRRCEDVAMRAHLRSESRGVSARPRASGGGCGGGGGRSDRSLSVRRSLSCGALHERLRTLQQRRRSN